MEKLLLVLILMLVSKSSITNTPKTDNMLMDIEFQDYFVNDKIDLKINNVLICKDVVVNSSESTGFTDVTIIINKLDKNLAQIHYSNLTSNIKLTDKIKIDIFLNGVENVFVVDGSKGKYVGFSKKDGNQLYFMQRTRRFVYD